ncbi:MAG: hypothetical protein ACN4GK_12410 [Acidimicrobiia bacterium]
MEFGVGIFMIVMATGIVAIWTRDIVTAASLDISRGRWKARDPRSQSLLLPHWVAEYGTALALLIGGVGLVLDWRSGRSISFAALGALLYTSTNSLGWVLADRSRIVYGVPMVIGACGALICIVILI